METVLPALTAELLGALHRAADTGLDTETRDGSLSIVFRALPDSAVAAVVLLVGQLVVVVDLAKPDAIQHAGVLLRGEAWRLFGRIKIDQSELRQPGGIHHPDAVGALLHRVLPLPRRPLMAAEHRIGLSTI